MTDLNKILYALSYVKAVLQPAANRVRSVTQGDAMAIMKVLEDALACEIWNNTREKK